MEDQEQVGQACRYPPALDDLTLLAAVDGEADPLTQAHLAACPSCAMRQREFALLQQQLLKRLYRAFCPETDELAAYHHGMLAAHRHGSIAAHVQACPHCSRELGLLGERSPGPLLAVPTQRV